jgi:hypothetical protein
MLDSGWSSMRRISRYRPLERNEMVEKNRDESDNGLVNWPTAIAIIAFFMFVVGLCWIVRTT